MQTSSTISLSSAKRFLKDPAGANAHTLQWATTITDDAARVLCGYHGDLILTGLSQLSDTAAEYLSEHEGCLALDNLSELSDNAARSLAKHRGPLNLHGILKLSDEAAEAFSGHQYNLWLTGLADSSTGKITGLSKAGLTALKKHPSLLLDFTSLIGCYPPGIGQSIIDEWIKEAKPVSGSA